MISSVDYVFNWARKSAIWPLTFGLACCAIEMIASTTARFDIARFGAEVFRPSPRQADLMIVAGTVTLKMGPVLKRVWEQMPDPKWCISMGACSSVGGPFNVYSVLQGVDRVVPVDVYVIGCPPRPEGLRSEEHTSELQSLAYLVCRLLLEKKKQKTSRMYRPYVAPHRA